MIWTSRLRRRGRLLSDTSDTAPHEASQRKEFNNCMSMGTLYEDSRTRFCRVPGFLLRVDAFAHLQVSCKV
jgi:hypothetical protein